MASDPKKLTADSLLADLQEGRMVQCSTYIATSLGYDPSDLVGIFHLTKEGQPVSAHFIDSPQALTKLLMIIASAGNATFGREAMLQEIHPLFDLFAKTIVVHGNPDDEPLPN